MRSLACGVAFGACLWIVGARPAHADDTGHTARIAAVLGARAHVGALGDLYPWGWVAGAEAGYQLELEPIPGVLGVSWLLLYGQFDADPEAPVVTSTLQLVDIAFDVTGRVPLRAEVPAFLVVRAGLELLRADVPIPPDSQRQYVGWPSVGLGLEVRLGDSFLLSVGSRYGAFFDGPAGLTFLLSLGLVGT
jgi:hypothetical protein